MKVGVVSEKGVDFSTGLYSQNVLLWLELMADYLKNDEVLHMDEAYAGIDNNGLGMMWATAVHMERVDLTAVIPRWGQSRGWDEEDRELWSHVVGMAKDLMVVGKSGEEGLQDRVADAILESCDMILMVGHEVYADVDGKSWILYNPYTNEVMGSDDVRKRFGIND